MNGTNIGVGALTGAITGAFVYAGGMVGGALAGVINASITGGDIGQGALWGAIGAGAGYLTGYAIGGLDISNQYVAAGVSIAAGGLVGGGLSALAGGDFVQGFTRAITGAAAGYFASMGMEHILKQSAKNTSAQQEEEKTYIQLVVNNGEECHTVDLLLKVSDTATGVVGGKGPTGPSAQGFFSTCGYEVRGTWKVCYYGDGSTSAQQISSYWATGPRYLTEWAGACSKWIWRVDDGPWLKGLPVGPPPMGIKL